MRLLSGGRRATGGIRERGEIRGRRGEKWRCAKMKTNGGEEKADSRGWWKLLQRPSIFSPGKKTKKKTSQI